MNKKIIFLDFEKGLGENYKDWTREAVQEFINLFPEYKDNFEVKDGNVGYHDIETLDAIVAQNKEIYNQRGQVFNEAEFWDQFDVTEPGKCHASLSKQAALASKDGVLDIQKLNKLQADSVGNMYNHTSPVIIGVSKRPAAGNIRGISSEIGVNISAGTCERLGLSREALKAYFKDIVIHELGHTFRAANENQRNTVENLGSHCKDPNCLMYEYSYTADSFNRRHRQKKESPFCSDCMESMRHYMEHDLKFERKEQEAVEVENTPEQLPKEADKNRKPRQAAPLPRAGRHGAFGAGRLSRVRGRRAPLRRGRAHTVLRRPLRQPRPVLFEGGHLLPQRRDALPPFGLRRAAHRLRTRRFGGLVRGKVLCLRHAPRRREVHPRARWGRGGAVPPRSGEPCGRRCAPLPERGQSLCA